MATLMRVKLRWSGFVGSPGYSIFHMRDFTGGEPDAAQAQGAIDRVDAFAEAIKGTLPSVVKLTVMPDVELIEDTTGQLSSVLTGTPAAEHKNTGAVGVAFAAPVGSVITWRTGGVRAGRRIRGRTFIVPMVSSMFDSDGTLSSGCMTTLTTAATALVNGAGTPDMGVYARPSGPGATDGEWSVATSFSIPDMGAVLRSRRD